MKGCRREKRNDVIGRRGTELQSVMLRRASPLLLLCLLPAVAPLFCYTCVFPADSPLDCIRFPLNCPPGRVCATSRAEGAKGDFRVVLYDKSCILPALCGDTGQKYTLGLNFTFTNQCCDTHLCNDASPPTPPPPAGRHWAGALLALLFAYPAW